MDEATSRKTGRHLGVSEGDTAGFSLFAPQNVRNLEHTTINDPEIRTATT